MMLEVKIMTVTKVFKCGNSKAIRIPKDDPLEVGDEVEIIKDGPRRYLRQEFRTF